MFTPAELIESLRRRVRRSIRPLPLADGAPPSWKAWFQSNAAAAGPADVTRAREIVAIFAARTPAPRPPVEQLQGWRAFRALWRQQWEPPSRDERGLRVVSRSLSVLLHLGLVVIMSWLMHARFMAAPPADAQRGEHVTEVVFIGSGTPEEEGGGAPPEPAPEPVVQTQTPAPPAPALPTPLPEQEPDLLPTPEPESAPAAVVESEPEPEPLPPTPEPEQPLVVTETPLPDGTFQVPPIQAVEVPAPQLREVEVAPRTRGIELAESRELNAPPMQPIDIPAREPAQPQVELEEREIALRERAPETPAPEIRVPDIQGPTLNPGSQQARTRDIPMPPTPDPGESAEAMPAADEGDVAQAEAGQGTEADRGEDLMAGAGPAQVARDGSWTTPQRGDDRGASTVDRPGGQAGTSSLFNPDGSVRLPPGQGRVGGGLPPGTITEDYENIDRMGTWLKRPPTDYEPTSFDRFWVPHENLLEEWVRRSIRTVLIPIPGTGKSIRCNVATLAFAGGCDLVDPNLQDDPASARPPPDIPFRPELQEDQEGLSDDVWR